MIEDVHSYIIVSMIEIKLCTLCKLDKSRDEFGTKSNGKPNSWCKQCIRDRARAHYVAKNPGARNYKDIDALPYGKRDDPDYDRRYQLINKYKLTPEMVEQRLLDQEGKCAVCLTLFEGLNFSVDHDHNCCPDQSSCGECVRGFLCTPCNTGLGKLKDDTAILRRAIVYLERS